MAHLEHGPLGSWPTWIMPLHARRDRARASLPPRAFERGRWRSFGDEAHLEYIESQPGLHRIAAWTAQDCSLDCTGLQPGLHRVAVWRRSEAHAAMAAEALLRLGEDGVCFRRLLVVHDQHLHVRAQRVVRRELLEDRDLHVESRRVGDLGQASRPHRSLPWALSGSAARPECIVRSGAEKVSPRSSGQ